ncbi:hypothetical protein SAMN06265795_11572 [Noviherbaspirillum humi]|uniref:Uncharacterized protein n=1 Tax=Noviherbaspirillum humi TaxID=1688639 RepID=A0A239KC84_9BURK|nr:hypothetical protein [Noviherbaspirillum humi]SNT15283.1 hypothetical protein SAMN06265795_11572 [Noviherbaspirillum humi]
MQAGNHAERPLCRLLHRAFFHSLLEFDQEMAFASLISSGHQTIAAAFAAKKFL